MPNLIREHFSKIYSNRRTILLLILISAFLLATAPSYGNEEEEKEAGTGPESVSDYLKKTLLMDIESASYYELQVWLRRLELSLEGDRESLQQRLREHYRGIFPDLMMGEEDFSDTGPTADKKEERRTPLTIEKAGELEFHAEEQTGEAEIELSGGILVYMYDEETGTKHQVEAYSLVFNRREARLTARGSVRYLMTEGERREEFTGEEVSFNVETYQGLFIGGMSSKSREIEGQTVSFYFRGDLIHRPAADRVFLEEGMISSSTVKDPYYHVATDRLWVLGPDEWAFSDALLYMGRVPIFYFPFFFHPGDDIIFHPSFGYRSMEGYYVQTTTYLLGRKKDQGRNENSLSFLQVIEEDSSLYSQKRHGIFLRQSKEPAVERWEDRTDSHIKYLLDVYSRAGLFSGFDIELNELGSMKKFHAQTGLGFTNYIYPMESYDSYSIFRFDGMTGQYARDRHEPWVFGTQLPLRFALNVDTEFSWPQLQWSLKLPFYSDPYFHLRFDRRDEEILWGSLLQGEQLDTLERDRIENPEFISHFQFAPSLPKKLRRINSFSLDRFDSSLALNDANIPKDFSGYEESLASENELGFYYPELWTPIDASITLRGRLFDSDWRDLAPERNSGGGGEDAYRAPWEESGETRDDEEGEESEESRYREPRDHGKVGRYSREAPETYTHSLDYHLNPEFSYHSRFDDAQIKDPASVDFNPNFSYLDADGYGLLSYDAKLYGPYLVLRNDISFTGRYREHFEGKEGVDLSDEREQDRSINRYTIDNKFGLESYFLDEYRELDTSKLSYTLDSRLLTYSYREEDEEYLSEFVTWDDERIKSHRMRMDLIRREDEQRQELYLQGALPPITPDNLGGVRARSGPLEGELKFRSRRDDIEEEWIHGPLDSLVKLSLWEQSYLSQEFHLLIPQEEDYSRSGLRIAFLEGDVAAQQSFDWNLDRERPEKSKSSLILWFFTGELEYRHLPDYEFDFGNGGWIEQESSAFQPYRTTARIDARYEADPFWKNRIRLSTGLSTAFQMDLQRFTDNVLNIGLEIDAAIAEFFEFRLNLNSENRAIYSYVPEYAERLGVERRSPFKDFLRSLNIFDSEDLLRTNFNLKSLSLEAIHHMHDWDLRFIYSGEPLLDDINKRYRWESEFTILVQWKPIPEIRKEAEYGNEELLF